MLYLVGVSPDEGVRPVRSEELKRFLDFVKESQDLYETAKKNMQQEDRRLQDFLHAIEFEPTAKKRSKVCTRLHKSREERRRYKDLVEETEDLVKFFEEPQNKKTLDKMVQLLGKLRKVEKYHRERSYYPRVKE